MGRVLGLPALSALVLTCALLACPAAAEPPQSTQFVRAKALLAKLAVRSAELKRKEEFQAKPREEKLVLRFKEGAEAFEGERLDGVYVIREILRWDPVRRRIVPDKVKRALSLLPEAFRTRYGFVYTRCKALRKQKRHAGELLVASLTDERRHVRELAIGCLQAMYGDLRPYRVDGDRNELKRRQKDWRRALPR
ncbi:MAG: hypothetical protein ACYTEZ_16545 [Planctomycetota bacterium]|jgi:hypothetical protein